MTYASMRARPCNTHPWVITDTEAKHRPPGKGKGCDLARYPTEREAMAHLARLPEADVERGRYRVDGPPD